MLLALLLLVLLLVVLKLSVLLLAVLLLGMVDLAFHDNLYTGLGLSIHIHRTNGTLTNPGSMHEYSIMISSKTAKKHIAEPFV